MIIFKITALLGASGEENVSKSTVCPSSPCVWVSNSLFFRLTQFSGLSLFLYWPIPSHCPACQNWEIPWQKAGVRPSLLIGVSGKGFLYQLWVFQHVFVWVFIGLGNLFESYNIALFWEIYERVCNTVKTKFTVPR